jgi:nicotinate-nucleotide pyrophosphorylase (carboxylating)
VIAKQKGIICGIDFFEESLHKIDKNISLSILKSNGETVKKGDKVNTFNGYASSLLKAERVALNFFGKFSGIATLTNQFVKLTEHTNAKILDTRKTTPAYRLLEKFAVRIGGGTNHRIGLYDMVMIKDNHIDACGSISKAIEKVQSYLKNENKENIKIEVEVKDSTELKEALNYDIHRVLLDNMTLDQLTECVEINKNKVELEASGNVSLETVKDIAETGVDFISVGLITHSAPTFDFSMRINTNG